MKSVFLFFIPVICLGLRGRDITEKVVAFQGIPYARQPIGKDRFKESVPIAYSEDLPASWKRCLSTTMEAGRGEDCLFLSVFRDKTVQKKTKTLLIITNDKLDDLKVAGLASTELNVVVASTRDGVLSSFGGAPYGVSDVISVFTFLKTNAEQLLIGGITVWAEGSLAETVAAAQNSVDAAGTILVNGFATSRTFEREKYGARAVYKLRTETECDLPSFDQSVDCLRSKPIEELMEKTDLVVKSFSPFGNPFRSPRGYVPEKAIPTILGVYGDLPKDYPNKDDYPDDYSTHKFKKFLAALIPNSLHPNAPLLRRLIMHQYIYSLGNKMDKYFLYQSSRTILLDRDFRVPIQQFIDHYVRHKRKLWVLEYNIETTQPSCLGSDTEEQYSGFCERLLSYFTRFAAHGAPTSESCDPKNPTFPFMGGSKRPYFIRLTADGQPEWEFNYHKSAVELWTQLLPSLDTLELAGRRDAQFEEEKEVDPLELEDDVQMWHMRAESDQTVLTEEKALNDMPYKQEL